MHKTVCTPTPFTPFTWRI